MLFYYCVRCCSIYHQDNICQRNSSVNSTVEEIAAVAKTVMLYAAKKRSSSVSICGPLNLSLCLCVYECVWTTSANSRVRQDLVAYQKETADSLLLFNWMVFVVRSIARRGTVVPYSTADRSQYYRRCKSTALALMIAFMRVGGRPLLGCPMVLSTHVLLLQQQWRTALYREDLEENITYRQRKRDWKKCSHFARQHLWLRWSSLSQCTLVAFARNIMAEGISALPIGLSSLWAYKPRRYNFYLFYVRKKKPTCP